MTTLNDRKAEKSSCSRERPLAALVIDCDIVEVSRAIIDGLETVNVQHDTGDGAATILALTRSKLVGNGLVLSVRMEYVLRDFCPT